MKDSSSKFCPLIMASAIVQNLSVKALTTSLYSCFLAMFLTACGGSSESGPVSDNQLTTQYDDNFTQALPAPSTPDTQDPQINDNSSYNLGGTSEAVIDQCMTNTDKNMLTHVNDVRSQPRLCGSVNYPAVDALSWHCTLEDIAYDHSRDMGDHNFFSHTGSDGLGPGERVRNAGYDWVSVGENIAAGQQSIKTVMMAWLESPGHCVNIMNSSYTEFGAASYNVDGSDFPIYWTQVFARPRL